MKLSVVLATKNEEANIKDCLLSVRGIADEIIVVDEYSTDKTPEIARMMGAKVFKNKHINNFHESKQLAIEKARGDWILQLDADERVSPDLSREIVEVINLEDKEIISRRPDDKNKWKLFKRHENALRRRGGMTAGKGDVAGFFIPRKNYFLGKPLIHGGVYPDAVIRLVKKNKAYLPAKNVHEQMVVKGKVAWLFSDLEHFESPTLRRYLMRLNRYTSEHAKDISASGVGKNYKNLLSYTFLKPGLTFVKMYFRHRGYKDGLRGFVWCVFSSFHYPLAFYKHWINEG